MFEKKELMGLNVDIIAGTIAFFSSWEIFVLEEYI